MYCWEAAKTSQGAITKLLLFRKSTGVILRDALPALQRLCANGPFEDCQVRIFVKQHAFPSANVCEAGLIAKCECLWSSQTGGCSSYLLLKIKQFAAAKTVNSLHDVPTYTNFLSTSRWYAFRNTLTGGLKSAKNECLWSSIEKTAEAFTCCRKNIYTRAKIGQISTWYVLTQ